MAEKLCELKKKGGGVVIPVCFDNGRFPTSGTMTVNTAYSIQIDPSICKITGVWFYYYDSFQGSGACSIFVTENGQVYPEWWGGDSYLDPNLWTINQANNSIDFRTKNQSWYGYGYMSKFYIIGYK